MLRFEGTAAGEREREKRGPTQRDAAERSLFSSSPEDEPTRMSLSTTVARIKGGRGLNPPKTKGLSTGRAEGDGGAQMQKLSAESCCLQSG